MKEIFFAGGCFWGTEHFFKQIKGVTFTEVGYANGRQDWREALGLNADEVADHDAGPGYKQVCTDLTGFAETVRVQYDPDVISLDFLLQMYFAAIDPTSLNRQGHDEGTQYRTGVYYVDAEDVPAIRKALDTEQEKYAEPIVVELLPLKDFYRAEEYHQDYLDKNPKGYCHLPESLFEFARKAKEQKPAE
ncbi:MAG: peptide-methionine (S)-S-oxide reductase MsrA [Bacteroidales bacterium]|nr:peptide-methionine (S)-S-oxide reductase MsrA [Bacteroidales bacterium]